MKNPALRTYARLVCVGLALATAVPSTAQTPITVQVINDSGLPDSAVYLLVAGQDVGVVSPSAAAINYPFAVSGVAATPVGTVTNTTSALVTNAGTTLPASAPLSVTGAASTITMSFAPATIASGQTSTLTINVPNPAAPQVLSYPFTVSLPSGVTLSSLQSSLTTCPGVTTTSTQVTIPAGTSITQTACAIVATVTSGTPGTVSATTSFLQTAPANVLPASAPLTVVTATSAMTLAFVPASIAAVLDATATLTIALPNSTNSAQTLSAPFTDPMPPGVAVITKLGHQGSCPGVTLVPSQITMNQGATIPPGGCTIVVTVTPMATGGALSGLAQAGLQVTSPYTGKELPVYQFSMSTVSSGNLFVSYNEPVAYPPAPTVTSTYRFQPLEFSYSQFIVSNGDLTSIDFYGIPLELQTYAPTDLAFQYPLDTVTYYTSTPTLRRAFMGVHNSLQNAFVGSGPGGNAIFNPGPSNDYSTFLRIIGPNQAAAPGASPIPGGLPAGKSKPWPYPSFAGYLDALAKSGYTFNEVDNGVISAYTFNYTGTITKMTAASTATCLAPSLAADGWLIMLKGTTSAPSPLPNNADICIPLPAVDPGTGSADFIIYGAVQNCESLGLASGSLYSCSDADKAALGAMSNSVYGWIQADVLSALNFGYMQGVADEQTGGAGYSNVWYNLPPVQYPFGFARAGASFAANDGRYNIWAALMYNHSDAYGFAFSDRKGRPSPDIAYPIGGTLRIWILPDKRLDAPIVTAGGRAGAITDTSIPLVWQQVEGADHYGVTWSPPYTAATATATNPGYTIQGLMPGTPYTITVTAYGAGGTRSHAMSAQATTTGATPQPAAGNANFVFGVNWSLPTFPQLPAPQPVTATSQSAPLTVTTATWFADVTFLPATLPPGGSSTMTITLGNTDGAVGTLAAAFVVPMPGGVTLTSATNTGTCPGVSVGPTQISIPSTTQIQAGGCTIIVTVTAPAVGTYTATTSTLMVTAGSPSTTTTYPAVNASLAVTASTSYIAQTIAPGTVAPGTKLPIVPSTMTLALANTNATALVLSAPYTFNLPAGMTTTSLYLGTCPGVTVTPQTVSGGVTAPAMISMPANTVIPAGGCTIAVNVAASAPGTIINAPGTLYANTIPAPDLYIAGTQYLYTGSNGYSAPPGVSPSITLGATQSYPLEVRLNGARVWSANYYLTFEGTPNSFSVGPCGPTDTCVGPNPASQSVPFDTVGAPNYLERQSGGLSPAGGGNQGTTGPPFGGTHGVPNIGVSFTPVANKRPAPVSYPSLGSAPPRSGADQCSTVRMPASGCQ